MTFRLATGWSLAVDPEIRENREPILKTSMTGATDRFTHPQALDRFRTVAIIGPFTEMKALNAKLPPPDVARK